MTSCARHISFTDAQGLRLALYKGLHATTARLVQKVVAEADHGNRALWVKLAKMLDVPGVAHRKAILSLKADSAGPCDLFHSIRAFPLRRQLVGILGGLNAPKNKVAFLETSGFNLAAMVAAQSLLVSSSSYSSLKTVFLKEQCVILPRLLLLELIVSEYSWRPVYEFRGENCLCSIDKSKGCLSSGSIWCRSD